MKLFSRLVAPSWSFFLKKTRFIFFISRYEVQRFSGVMFRCRNELDIEDIDL